MRQVICWFFYIGKIPGLRRFWTVTNLHTRLAIVTANKLGLAFPRKNLPKKFRPDPSTFYCGNKQTDKRTPVITLSLAKAFAGIIKNPHKTCFFSRMRRSVTAESIPTKFCTSTPWGDTVIYLTWHRNWLRGFGGVGCENEPLPLTLALASNTAYCATAHTRDIWALKASFAWKMMEISQPKGNKRMQNDMFIKKIKLSYQTELQNFINGHPRS